MGSVALWECASNGDGGSNPPAPPNNKMNIGIYGHSIAYYKNNDTNHFISLLQNHFKAKIVHTGIVQCSEERILFNLKKTKNLDLAIIFHVPPYNIFVPSWNRDISTVDKDTFNKKIVPKEWIEQIGLFDKEDQINEFLELFEKIPNGAIFQILEHLEINIEDYTNEIKQWFDGNNEPIKNVINKYAEQIDQVDFFNEMYTALDLQKKYLSHPDLQMNRYYGALIQIDQYLTSQNIKAVHFLDKESWYPKWFDFTSGPYDREIQKIQKPTSPYYVGYHTSSNAINKEGNQLIFKRILELLNG